MTRWWSNRLNTKWRTMKSSQRRDRDAGGGGGGGRGGQRRKSGGKQFLHLIFYLKFEPRIKSNGFPGGASLCIRKPLDVSPPEIPLYIASYSSRFFDFVPSPPFSIQIKNFTLDSSSSCLVPKSASNFLCFIRFFSLKF